jgi:hypothetical protein
VAPRAQANRTDAVIRIIEGCWPQTRVRDRVNDGSERIHFSSAILPPYARPFEEASKC